MNSEVELINKEVLRLQKEIVKYQKRINDNKKEIEAATNSQNLLIKLAREVEDRFSDYLNSVKRKSGMLSEYNKFGQKQYQEIKQVFRTSSAYQMIGQLEENSRKAQKICERKEEEISQWKKEIQLLEEQLRECKTKLLQIGG